MFWGRAKPLFQEQELRRMRGIPQYRLRFRIPRAKPGAYAFVIYCGDCYPGPRGGLIVDPSSHLLHVGRAGSIASTATGTGKDWWIVAGAALLLLGGGAVLLRRRLAA